jgi:hypothetical protein
MNELPRLRYPRLSIHERAQRAVASGRIIFYLGAAIAALAVATGFIASLIDRKDFPTLGDESGGRSSPSEPSATATSFPTRPGGES